MIAIAYDGTIIFQFILVVVLNNKVFKKDLVIKIRRLNISAFFPCSSQLLGECDDIKVQKVRYVRVEIFQNIEYHKVVNFV